MTTGDGDDREEELSCGCVHPIAVPWNIGSVLWVELYTYFEPSETVHGVSYDEKSARVERSAAQSLS
jgi:hypothetical protein